ncbi:tRNA lysidine(34) synthetase TilS [Nitrosospira briensis]|uniref:tRNA lysidine(34) synthetase TilS n=1 Tax=Nitrosospira briensis TaxID=35799 RepID=UPI000943E276|nr:tRNA lysidine(34) synthetase TilS [Nitrosospira briensis]
MANSRKSKSGSIFRKAESVLREQIKAGAHLTAGLSGGVDSVVLLDLLDQLSAQMQFSLSAIHVNHGISGNADKWSEFCLDLCRSRSIPLTIATLKISREPGDSLEALARDERYRVFGELKTDYVVLAQHLDDQAETLLLQLLRGAGVKGLGAMPVVRNLAIEVKTQLVTSRSLPRILRPMLEVSRREIEDYAREHALKWITDESNDNLSFDRNLLRHEFFPLLEKRFPSYRTTFLRASRHMAEASTLLDELAEADGNACLVQGKLHVEDLRKLSFPRAKNLLRYTLVQQGAILPSTTRLEEILRQLLCSRQDAKLNISFGNAEVRCFQGVVHVRHIDEQRALGSRSREWELAWHGEKRLVIDELGGTLEFIPRKGAGISLRKLSENPVTIRPRQGGERLRPDQKRPRRSVKNLLREASLPPWERETLPLIFSGNQLVCVPGMGVDCAFQAVAEEPGLMVEWQANK